MRSQLRFVMHLEDEREFISEVVREDAVVLINGPRWKSNEPEVHHSLDSIDWYCIIWSRKDLAKLDAEFIPKCNDWYCRSEGATIQFLRSRNNGSVLIEGRLAISTDSEPSEVARAVEKRYRSLRSFVKKRYRNGMLQWRSRSFPESPAAVGRSSNPGKTDNSLWIGPSAAQWLRQDPMMRKVKQDFSAPVEAELTLDAREEPPPDS
jgi:hypothetical protein